MELLGLFMVGGSLLSKNGVEAREVKYKSHSLMADEKTPCRCNAGPPNKQKTERIKSPPSSFHTPVQDHKVTR